jgi:sugar lactone lactonase YvrE
VRLAAVAILALLSLPSATQAAPNGDPLTALAASPLAAASTGWQGLVVNGVSTANSLTPFDTAGNTPSQAIELSGGVFPSSVAISPDATRAWVAESGDNNSDGSLVPVDLTQSPAVAGTPVTITGGSTSEFCVNGPEHIFAGLFDIALAPDGGTAYISDLATDQVFPVDLTQDPPVPGSAISLPSGAAPQGVAVSPDGNTLYVADSGIDKVSVIPLHGGSASALSLTAGAKPNAIAITPNGARAYVTEGGRDKLVPIALPANTVGSEISVGSGPDGVAVTPDGAKVYVANGGTGFTPDSMGNCVAGAPSSDNVSVVSTSTDTAGTPFDGGETARLDEGDRGPLQRRRRLRTEPQLNRGSGVRGQTES